MSAEKQNIVLTLGELSEIVRNTSANERNQGKDQIFAMFNTITRMHQVLTLLRADKSCFCSMPVHTVACRKATEIVNLLNPRGDQSENVL